jgi:photosystem II stability/assembly factor-like uncharacterized protein
VDWATVLGDSLFTPHVYDAHIAADGTITIAGEFSIVAQSKDNGVTWAPTNTGEESIFKLSIEESGAGLAVGQNGLVLRTGDSGASWTKVSLDTSANLLGVSLNGSNAAIVGIRAAFTSSDGGSTWDALVGGDIATGWYQAVAHPESGGAGVPVAVGHSGRIVAIN